jgi:hypothetical protein
MEAGQHAESREPVVGARISSLRDKLNAAVAAVIAESEAATQRAVDEARQQFELVEQELHRQLSAALDDLEKQRDDARALKNQVALERTAKERAEASYSVAQATQHQVAAGYIERIHALEHEVENARREASRLAAEVESGAAERRRVSAILESIRSAVGGGLPVASAIETSNALPEATPQPSAQPAAADTARNHDEQPAAVGQFTSNAAATFKVVARGRVEPDEALITCAKQLLEQVEESYQSDVESLQRPADVVDRLVIQLRTARELFTAQCNGDETFANEEFDRQVSLVLDTKGATAYGRHLGIAWYEVSQPIDRVTHAVA